jgi:hypothetical protein
MSNDEGLISNGYIRPRTMGYGLPTTIQIPRTSLLLRMKIVSLRQRRVLLNEDYRLRTTD